MTPNQSEITFPLGMGYSILTPEDSLEGSRKSNATPNPQGSSLKLDPYDATVMLITCEGRVELGVTVDALFSDISSNSAGLHFLLRVYM